MIDETDAERAARSHLEKGTMLTDHTVDVICRLALARGDQLRASERKQADVEGALKAMISDAANCTHDNEACPRYEACDEAVGGDCSEHGADCPSCECGVARTQTLAAAARQVLEGHQWVWK